MNDAELLRELRFLGIDQHSWRALALLPLVQVAWADGQVQDTERELILRVAGEKYQLDGEGKRLLESWLRFSPTSTYLQRGRKALIEVIRRNHPSGNPTEGLSDVLAMAKEVASAAGGLFGFWKVDTAEKAALEEIATALAANHEASWRTAMSDLGEEADEADSKETLQPIDDFEPDEITDVRTVEDLTREAAKDAHVEFKPPEPSATENSAVLVHVEDGNEASYPITGTMTIGRNRGNTVQIAGDARVSRFHCQVWMSDNKLYIKDLSSNGTLVNGERISERRLFGDEDIVVGGTRFVVRLQPKPAGG